MSWISLSSPGWPQTHSSPTSGHYAQLSNFKISSREVLNVSNTKRFFFSDRDDRSDHCVLSIQEMSAIIIYNYTCKKNGKWGGGYRALTESGPALPFGGTEPIGSWSW